MEAESVGGLVLWRCQDLGTCPQKSNENGVAGAEPSLAVHSDD